MITRLHIFLVMTFTVVLMSIALIIFSKQREADFVSHQKEMQQGMLDGAAREISRLIDSQVRMARLLNDEYRQLVTHLSTYPHDQSSYQTILTRLQQHLPDTSSFTITDSAGKSLIQNDSVPISKICIQDITAFSAEARRVGKDRPNTIFMHTDKGDDHYGVINTIRGREDGVFIIRFPPDPVRDILKSREIAGHQLMLVRHDDYPLIELTSSGGRNRIAREPRLSAAEQLRIEGSSEIPGTQWLLVDIHDHANIQRHSKKLWKSSISILLVFVLSNIFIYMILSSRLKYSEIRGKTRKNRICSWLRKKQ